MSTPNRQTHRQELASKSYTNGNLSHILETRQHNVKCETLYSLDAILFDSIRKLTYCTIHMLGQSCKNYCHTNPFLAKTLYSLHAIPFNTLRKLTYCTTDMLGHDILHKQFKFCLLLHKHWEGAR